MQETAEVLAAAADATAVEVTAKFFRALGDPTRLRLLEFLLDAEHTVSECVTHIGLAQSRVSTHLACLADCGYVTARRQGRFSYYRAADARVGTLIAAARSLAVEHARALDACTRIEQPPEVSMG
jgi:ArsR family transcriptional regulator, cadmium/lead-responsive transcriptional repressor